MKITNQQKLDKYLDKLITKAEKEIDKIYLARQKEILNQISTLYEKYEIDGKLTRAEMTKYNRLNNAQKSITNEILQAHKQASKITQKTMEQQYLENYFKTAYLTEYQSQQKLGYGALNKRAIEKALENNIEGLTLANTLKDNRKAIVKKIQLELGQGIAIGESYGKMSKRIKDVVGFSANKSRTVARTEAHRVQQQGRRDSIQHAINRGLDIKKTWDATLDSNTRRAHQKLDGMTKSVDNDFISSNGGRGYGPAEMNNASDDINCRCTLRYSVNGKTPDTSRARENGKNREIPWTSYEDWQKNRIGKLVKND